MTQEFIPYYDILKEQKEYFEAIDSFVRNVAIGDSNALIISGPPGVGKTYGVVKQLKELSSTGSIYLEELKGYAKATGLYGLLYAMRHKDSVLLIDDADSVFRDETGLNILKGALDTSKVREISWRSNTKITLPAEYAGPGDIIDEKKQEFTVPKKFIFEGKVIFITNIDIEGESKKKNKMAPHFAALMSRSQYIKLNIETDRDMMIRITNIVLENKLLVKEYGLDGDQSIAALRFLEEHLSKVRELSIRTVMKIGALIKSNPANWKMLAKMSIISGIKTE